MFAVKALLATPGLVGLLAFAGLSLSAHAPSGESVTASAQTARIVAMRTVPEDSDAPPTMRRRFTRATDGLFYVTARVNGVKVRFLVDTGATMVVLTPGDAMRVGATDTVASRHAVMETAAGPSAIDRVTLDQVALAGHTVAGVDAAVVRRGLRVSLLGQDLLSRLGPVTISGNALELN
ncbi:TIGR02281 family clan AA aspartic protease [Sphingomonas sp. TREG-RG-20F-R18-01]|uniref:retropepsin-like aspartic protease family protein n=1 Tax=Sphingomonas sp. TREG-RG-20F-R18-01 TaxID=2914982 RepID=UPI001F589D98|nr:TIGR02281 family clan AA aspartic protease [Sphingomonas sp. TREG-RG-20F-R18-01]